MKKLFLYLFLLIILAQPILAQDLIIEGKGRALSIYKNCKNIIRINPNISYYETSNGIISKKGGNLVLKPDRSGKCQVFELV